MTDEPNEHADVPDRMDFDPTPRPNEGGEYNLNSFDPPTVDEETLQPVVQSSTVAATSNSRSPRVIIPGLEAICWLVGAFVAMISGSMLGALMYVLYQVAQHPEKKPALFELAKEAALPSAIGSQLGILCFGGLGAFVRYRSRLPEVFGFRMPTFAQLVAIVALTLPVQMLAQCWAVGASEVMQVWEIPDFKELYAEQMETLFSAGPIAVMWLLIALCPAVGEEVVFRGLIGTTLVRNWGPVWGVLVTSVLFGIMHLIPIQAIAVIPLGMAMHYVYLTTRSFWAPVLFHLCNNSLALLLMKLASDADIADLDDIVELPSRVSIALSLFSSAALIVWLWGTRKTAATETVAIEDSDDPGRDSLRAQQVESNDTELAALFSLALLTLGLGASAALAIVEIKSFIDA